MEEIIIYKYQAKRIENALRMCANLNSCRGEETAFDREVMLAIKHIKSVLDQQSKELPLMYTGTEIKPAADGK